jgi:crotonobetainyl-CoA:carnitine CoA-transferase CaiB-like acyl-CoA transferase
VQAAGGFVEIENPGGEPHQSVNTPITFRGNQLTRTRPVPTVGQHTREVLAEVGVSDEDLDALA